MLRGCYPYCSPRAIGPSVALLPGAGGRLTQVWALTAARVPASLPGVAAAGPGDGPVGGGARGSLEQPVPTVKPQTELSVLVARTKKPPADIFRLTADVAGLGGPVYRVRSDKFKDLEEAAQITLRQG